MKHNYPATNICAIKHTSNPFCCLKTQLKEAVAHGPGMRHSEIRSINFHPLSITQETGDESGRQTKYPVFERVAIERNSPSHGWSIANTLY